MHQENIFQSLLKVRKHRTAQAEKHFVEARQALEKAQGDLQEVNKRINHLQETMNVTVEKHYGLGLLPLGLLLNVQSHLKYLSEQLIQENRQQHQAWNAVEEADKIRAERVTSYMKMKDKDANVKERMHLIKQNHERVVEMREDELAGSNWFLNSL